MEGFSHKPLNPLLNDTQTVEKISPVTTESSPVVPDGYNSVAVMGENKFDRLQELGAILASGKDLSEKEKKEYTDLNKEFISTVEMNIEHNKELETKKNKNQNSIENSEMTVMDKERIERLKTLNQAKSLLGLLTEDEETERAVLISWYNASVLKELNKIANTAPKSIEFETPVEIFNEKDVSKWKNGAQKFKEFSKIINMKEKLIQKIDPVFFNPVVINELKALFLGEKPVVLLQQNIDLNNPDHLAMVNLLESFGVEIIGGYIYDKEQVKGVIEKNEEIFKVFNSKDPDEIIRLIAEENKLNGLEVKNHLATGVLLGFPLESVKKFKPYSEEEKDIKYPKKQHVNIYGIQWSDFEDSLESKIRQSRLKSAFELSGILNLK